MSSRVEQTKTITITKSKLSGASAKTNAGKKKCIHCQEKTQL